MDYSPSVSSVHGILQARILEWVAISFSRGSSWPRNRTLVSCIAGRFLTDWATSEALSTHSLLVHVVSLSLHLGHPCLAQRYSGDTCSTVLVLCWVSLGVQRALVGVGAQERSGAWDPHCSGIGSGERTQGRHGTSVRAWHGGQKKTEKSGQAETVNQVYWRPALCLTPCRRFCLLLCLFLFFFFFLNISCFCLAASGLCWGTRAGCCVKRHLSLRLADCSALVWA